MGLVLNWAKPFIFLFSRNNTRVFRAFLLLLLLLLSHLFSSPNTKMASIGRSAAAINNALRSASLRSKAALPKPSISQKPSLPFTRRSVVSALGAVESLMPLHSAIASARLKSFIASDSSYWSCLSQGLNKRI
ncbi:hypothetical protein LUZ60_015653 [Juncus effusus]|nr:hypothetical protein LUZ60_015653 [Juncus effusus]